jgi:transcriptional regulator with XRE-family HTH domain
MTSKIAEKLHDPEYRKAFVASEINIGLPFQVRALLKARGWTQGMLAEKADMLQPRISGLMSPGKTRPNIDTLRRLAEAFDCGLAVRFVPFSELAAWSEQFDPESFNVPDFEHDPGFVARKEPNIAAAKRLKPRRNQRHKVRHSTSP